LHIFADNVHGHMFPHVELEHLSDQELVRPPFVAWFELICEVLLEGAFSACNVRFAAASTDTFLAVMDAPDRGTTTLFAEVEARRVTFSWHEQRSIISLIAFFVTKSLLAILIIVKRPARASARSELAVILPSGKNLAAATDRR
jgi:hypothetical protein